MKEKFMLEAIKEANKSLRTNDFPVGCIITYGDKIISKKHNQKNKSNLTIDHAEIMAIMKANKRLNEWRLDNCDMYVTLKPCKMCQSVIKESRIRNVYILIDKDEERNQYSKTNFEMLNIANTEIDIAKNKYSSLISSFFENKRK